jgi:two-component system, NarL family, sensor histidine kinase UhpB
VLPRALTSSFRFILPQRWPLFWRAALTNAALLAVAVAALAISPATVSSPLALDEAAILALGTVVVTALSVLALKTMLAPVDAVAREMASVDPLTPGARVQEQRQYPEIAAITAGFNQMADRLEAERRESVLRSLRAQEAERTRVTRELHDEVGQTLTVLLLQLVHAARAAGPEAQERLGAAQETAREALEEVRRIGHRLRPESLDDLGLPSALITLADRIAGAAGMDVEAVIDPALPELDQEQTLAIFRIAQESLTNVVRHAGASRARLRLARSADCLSLSVRDDGHGPASDAVSHGGLGGMRERALAIGGDLTLERPPDGGFEVRLDVPCAGALA